MRQKQSNGSTDERRTEDSAHECGSGGARSWTEGSDGQPTRLAGSVV